MPGMVMALPVGAMPWKAPSWGAFQRDPKDDAVVMRGIDKLAGKRGQEGMRERRGRGVHAEGESRAASRHCWKRWVRI
jgi:hypothetical protein